MSTCLAVAMSGKDRPLSRIELLQGTLDLIILQTLRWGPRHGYGIAQMIRSGSRKVRQVDTGSLYPALHRLERQQLIAAEWTTSVGDRLRELLPPRSLDREAFPSARRQAVDSHALIVLLMNPPMAEAEP